jgi:hypothetical protein
MSSTAKRRSRQPGVRPGAERYSPLHPCLGTPRVSAAACRGQGCK